jgi:hypothetical protein
VPGFLPTEEDVIMARARTTGIITTEVLSMFIQQHRSCHDMSLTCIHAQVVIDDLTWQVVDVGGQRSERKKCMIALDSLLIVYAI